MEQNLAPAGGTRQVAVLIAHGVGEAEPGYAITTLMNTLRTCAGFRGDDEVRVRYLVDAETPAAQSGRSFPVFIGTGQLASGEQLTFAELFWADLTRVGPGRIDAILGLFRVIFESHHFIDGMLDRSKGLGHRALRRLLLIGSWMLRGPIIGLTVNTAAALWAALYILPRTVRWVPESLLFGAVFLSVFLISSTLLIWSWRRRDATWYDPTSWTALLAALLAGFGVGAYVLGIPLPCETLFPGQAEDCRQLHVDQIYSGLSNLWGIWGTIILVCFALAAGIVFRRRKRRHETSRVFAALGIVMLQFVLWTAIVGTAVMPLLYRAEEVKGVNALKNQYRNLPLEPEETTAKRILNVVPWDPKKSEWIDRVAFGYGFNGVMILCILLVGAITFVRRTRLTRKSLSGAFITAAQMPRLVIGSGILCALLVVAFFQALYLLLSVRIWSGEFFELIKGWPLADWIIAAAENYKRAIFAVGWVSSLALPILVGAKLGNPVHIARDLIDHQYSPRRASVLTVAHRRSRDPSGWPRRARIQARLSTLLDELVRNGKFDQVIFGVHSQGSVIAFDYLNDAAPDNKELGGLKPDLVTFGSPLAHLYQHYFFEYANLQSEIAALHNSIGRWINLYRVDDYIGTQIGQLTDQTIKNEQLGPGGHTDYWRLDRLAHVVIDLVTTSPSNLAGAMPAPQAQYTGREAQLR